MGIHDRALGALLGVHAGDSLGATVEFMPWSQVRERHPDGVREIVGGGPFGWEAGHATDDTDLTRALVIGYLTAGASGDVVDAAARSMVDWLRGHWPDREPGTFPRDVGGATRAGLTRYLASGDARRAGAGPGRAGNGSLMRCMPTALARSTRDERIVEAIMLSAITHDDPRCTVACAAYVEVAAALLEGQGVDDALTAGLSACTQLQDEVTAELGPAADLVAATIRAGMALDPADLAVTGPAGLPDQGGGFVLDSLTLAIAAVHDPRPFPDVLIDIVRLGADSDTNGAIAGGLLGARDGAGAIPASWVEKLQFGAEFTAAVPVLLALRTT